MNNPFEKMFLGWGLVLALAWISGCAATNQASPTATVNSTAAATVTLLLLGIFPDILLKQCPITFLPSILPL